MSKRVRAGSLYTYEPVFLDRIDGPKNVAEGDTVRVVNLPLAPKANTMGHAYIAHPTTGAFIGLVCTNSLQSRRKVSK